MDERRLRHFDFRDDREEAGPADGVVRSRSLAGLWIDAEALWAIDLARMSKTLAVGLASDEYGSETSINA